MDLPPANPPIKIEGSLQQLLSQANIALGRLDTMGYLLPNVDRIIAMYVRKEALLSPQIVKETTGKKRDRRYSYWEYLDCLSEGTQ